MDKNILGNKLETCSCSPMTGWYRDGLCRTDFNDKGIHTVCGVLTQDFLAFSLEIGNDLSTPRPEYHFPGLKPGDRWCICAGRWFEAYRAGRACPVILEATHEETLAIIPLNILKQFGHEV